MASQTCDMGALRHIILDSQHLIDKSTEPIETIVSDICGLQYDPNPTIHLNPYMMLWNRKKDFSAEQLDQAAYRDFTVLETWTFRRNLFLVPRCAYALYKAAAGGIVRWGESDRDWLRAGDSPDIRSAERELWDALAEGPGRSAAQIWDMLGLADEWNQYRRKHNPDYNLPLFRAFYRLVRKGELVTCGRNPGTFREPLYIRKDLVGLGDLSADGMEENTAVRWLVEKLILALGVTNPIHVSHISGYKTAEVAPVFAELEAAGRIVPLPYKVGRRLFYVHSSKAHLLDEHSVMAGTEVRLVSPMDTVVRDKAWLETFFDYSFSFEYFKKKGMKWPLSILVEDRFVGYLDCKMEWRTGRLVVKERNIFEGAYRGDRRIDAAIQALAAFHGTDTVVEKGLL